MKHKIFFGFEFESLVDRRARLLDYRANYHCGEWQAEFGHYLKFEEDASLRDADLIGIEIVSKRYTLAEFSKMKKEFLKVEQHIDKIEVNDTCGLHVSFSVKDIALPKIFLFSLLKTLRKDLLLSLNSEASEAYKRDYFRSYAQRIEGYSDYRKERNLEFNIKTDYIEWRSVHARHLKFYRNKELLKKVIDFIYSVNKILQNRIELFLKKGEEERIKEYNNAQFTIIEDNKKILKPDLIKLENKTIYV